MSERAPLPPPALPPLDTERLRTAFDAFLRKEGYTILTANKSAAAMHTLVELAMAGHALPSTFRVQAIRALRWLRHLESVKAEIRLTTPARALKDWLELALQGEKIEDPSPKKRHALKLDRMNDWQWRKLVALADERSSEVPEALVLRVALHTPLRIGRILSMPLDKLIVTLRNDSLRAQLQTLVKQGIGSLGKDYLMSKTPNAAYVMMKRHVHEVSEELGFDFDFNTIARSRENRPKD
jgi:hypothetical protein